MLFIIKETVEQNSRIYEQIPGVFFFPSAVIGTKTNNTIPSSF
jgi:hypothetical protein